MQVTDEMEKARDNWLAEVGRKRCFDLDEGFKAGYTAALSKAEPVGVGVKIKPLEWMKNTYGPTGELVSLTADLPGRESAYKIEPVTANTNFRLFIEGRERKHSEITYWPLAEAKAAAQSDYEQRILSALTPEGGAGTHSPVQHVAGYELPADIIESLLAIGKVEWGVSLTQTDDKHASDLLDTLRITREHFGITEAETGINGVYLEGTGTVLAHTGMSPNSPQHARILVGAWNQLVEIAKAHSAKPEADHG